MILSHFDSRASLGSDAERRAVARSLYTESSLHVGDWITTRQIRVVLGCLGGTYRLSAAELDIVEDGASVEQAWQAFLGTVRQRRDAAWLTFDVAPTRVEEIEQGLSASEDESWAEPVSGAGEG